MFQVMFNEDGKFHCVTFSGDEARKWANRFTTLLSNQSISYQTREI